MKSNILFGDQELFIEERTKGICLSYRQIVDFSTDKPYIKVSTTDNKSLYLETTLAELETHLPLFFFRCNQSTIVNLLLVSAYRKDKRKYILSTSLSKEFSVSPQNINLFKEVLTFYKTNQFISNDCISCGKAWTL